MKNSTLVLFLWLLIWTCGLYSVFSSFKTVHADDWWTGTQLKLDTMVSLGWDATIARELIVECKATAKDPARCVLIGNFIGWAESTGWQHKNVFWVMGKFIKIKNAVKDWVKRYNKYWYNMTKPSQFYGKGAVTWYCKSERQHKKSWCPIGLSNATRAYNYFISLTK